VNDKDQRHVESALHHLDVLKSYLEQGTMDDPVLFDAVSLRLGASIEVAAKLSDEARAQALDRCGKRSGRHGTELRTPTSTSTHS
jgi:hypothetical protein